MELWLQVIVSAYISTWVVMIFNTYSDIIRRMEALSPNSLVMRYRVLHFLIYVIGSFFLVLFAYKIAFYDEWKDRWVKAYVNALLEREK